MLEDDAENILSADVFMMPPEDDQLSAEDSDDEDNPSSINHLSGRQLSAEAEF